MDFWLSGAEIVKSNDLCDGESNVLAVGEAAPRSANGKSGCGSKSVVLTVSS